MTLNSLGVRCLVIFPNFKVCWVDEIEFETKFTDPSYLRTIRRGARTPFGLIRKDNPKLRNLEDALARL